MSSGRNIKFLCPCPGRGAAFFMPLRRTGTVPNTEASSPGLTRPSIFFERILRRAMDARVKPAHDENGVRCGPGSAAHHAVKNGALRCVRGTQPTSSLQNNVSSFLARLMGGDPEAERRQVDAGKHGFASPEHDRRDGKMDL